jgi:uncharacterized SAM-binding protein YcdF (DUF218 family)
VNDLATLFGIEGWKPVLGALLMPPLPLLLVALVGAALLHRRAALGWALLAFGLGGVWATSTSALGHALIDVLTRPPPALAPERIGELARSPKTAIVVLGAGRRLRAPEYGASDLPPLTSERLRYGAWLARQTGLPLVFSGGVGHGADPGATEAEIARRVAQRDFGVRLRWTEERSRDTNENGVYTVALLRDQGIERIVLVTHDFHMRRASAAFERTVRRHGVAMTIVAAPMGLRAPSGLPEFTAWLPSAEGLASTRFALHEWIGRLAGA